MSSMEASSVHVRFRRLRSHWYKHGQTTFYVSRLTRLDNSGTTRTNSFCMETKKPGNAQLRCFVDENPFVSRSCIPRTLGHACWRTRTTSKSAISTRNARGTTTRSGTNAKSIAARVYTTPVSEQSAYARRTVRLTNSPPSKSESNRNDVVQNRSRGQAGEDNRA